MGMIPLIAYLIDWGWIRIGPPYIYINIDPVIVHIGPVALRWYGLMYAVAILVGIQVAQGYAMRKGITQAMIYRVVWWCIVAGLIGGRLYFVVQQPNFFSYYLAQPQHILATWEGGMAFYGAIFLVIPTLIWRARREHINPLVLIDAGVLFAAAGQIFGRIGNLINGDIIGFHSTLPWSTVYQNPNSWACLNPATCNVPVQPAAAYELITNLVVLTVMLFLARRVRKPGILMLFYLFSYVISQFLLFFVRDNLVVSFLGLDWGLKQAQWTSLVVFIVLLPITYLVLRYSKTIPKGEIAATYGIAQKPAKDDADINDEETPVVLDTDTEDESSEQPAMAEGQEVSNAHPLEEDTTTEENIITPGDADTELVPLSEETPAENVPLTEQPTVHKVVTANVVDETEAKSQA
ncbi:MAG: prolipoprotein diacylglyceryl transferase [Ktedonobacteraceae bacterium]